MVLMLTYDSVAYTYMSLVVDVSRFNHVSSLLICSSTMLKQTTVAYFPRTSGPGPELGLLQKTKCGQRYLMFAFKEFVKLASLCCNYSKVTDRILYFTFDL